MVLEKTLDSPLNCKEIKSINSKENQFWIFIERTDDEVEAPILWPPDQKNELIRKYPDAGKHWRQEEKGITEDILVGWHHQFNGLEFQQAPGLQEGQGSLVCLSPWGSKDLDMTEQLNWTEYITKHFHFLEHSNNYDINVHIIDIEFNEEVKHGRSKVNFLNVALGLIT